MHLDIGQHLDGGGPQAVRRVGRDRQHQQRQHRYGNKGRRSEHARTVVDRADGIDKPIVRILTNCANSGTVAWMEPMSHMGADFCILAIFGNNPGKGPGLDCARSGPQWACIRPLPMCEPHAGRASVEKRAGK
jgi:hypothetical protein